MLSDKPKVQPSNWLIFIVFLGWVITTTGAGVFVKAWLVLVPFPFFVTFAQACLGTILTFAYLQFTGNLILKPSYAGASNFDIACVFGGHTIGTFLTNYANIGSSASFVNTLKACDPLFAVIGAKYVLNQEFSFLTYVSLVVIVGAIILACTTEFNFQFMGFVNAMVSTGLFVLRAIYTKKIMKTKTLDGQNIFLHITMVTTFIFGLLSIPECLGAIFEENWDTYYDSVPILFYASLSHWGYNILAFWLVMYLEPVTYSVGNSIKRLVTIFSSILYFRNPVSFFNGFSSIVAVIGVLMYSIEEEKRNAKQSVI